jgi:hypothetical protein
MRYLFLVMVVFTLLFSCSKRDKNKPVILTQPKMESIIWDIMQVDEYANTYISRDSLKDLNKERLQLYLKVFQLHKVSREDFNASIKYYSSKPDVMKVIFDSLSSKGELQRRKLIPLK